MKTFQVYLSTGQNVKIEGAMINVNEDSGQSIIYSENNPVYSNIVAVIPSNACVWILNEQPRSRIL